MAQERDTKHGQQLMSLAPELFERIALHADAQTLCNLRLVNREAAAKVYRTYTSTCFHTRSIILCREDTIKAAIDIAKHGTYGPAIKKLRIYIDIEIERHVSECDDREFRMAVLGRLFIMLETAEPRDIEIEFCELSPEKLPRSVNVSDLEKFRSPQAQFSGWVRQVTAALYGSTLAVRSVTMGQDCWTLSCCRDSFELYEFHHLNILFKALKHLSLGFWTSYDSGLHLLAKFIASATELESLKLRFVYEAEYDLWNGVELADVGGLIEALVPERFPQLRRLSLDNLHVDYDALIAFASKQDQLGSIDMRNCAIVTQAVLRYEIKMDETMGEAVQRHLGGKVAVAATWGEKEDD